MNTYNSGDFASTLTSKYLNSTSLQNGVFQGVASGSIANGELVTLNEGGFIRRVSERLSLSAHNLTAQGLNPVSGPTLCSYDAMTTNNLQPHKLPSGTTVYVQGRYLYFINPASNLMYRLDNGATINAMNVLSTGQVVTVWITGTGPYTINAKIWNENGSSQSGVFTVATTALLGSNTFNTTGNCFVVANGPNFHVSWEQHLTSGGPTMTNYVQTVRNDGTLIGATVQIITGSYPVVTAACANGDFAAVTLNSSYTPYFTRYSAGVQTVTAQLIQTAQGGAVAYLVAGANLSKGFQGFTELANGNFVTLSQDATTTTNGQLVFLNASGLVLQSYVQTGLSFNFVVGSPSSYSFVSSATGVAVFYAGGSGSSWGVFSNAFDNVGNVITAQQTYGSASQFTTAPKVIARTTGAGFCYVAFNGSITNLVATDIGGYLLGSVIVPTATTYNYIVSSTDGLVCFISSNGSTVNSASYKINRCSILGTAANDATDGQTITVLGMGNFSTPASQPFAGTLSFDNRSAVIPGCRGTVSGTFCTLFGFV